MANPADISSNGETLVTMDRRRSDRRQEGGEIETPVAKDPRRKVQRRRQIDPTTCERDYSNDEIEFMQALDAYKRAAGRMFPTCSEILEVIRSLGYVRLNEEQQSLLADAFESSFCPGDDYDPSAEEDDFADDLHDE